MAKRSHNRARKDYAAYCIIGPDGRHVLKDARMQVYWMKRVADAEAEILSARDGETYTVENITIYRPGAKRE